MVFSTVATVLFPSDKSNMVVWSAEVCIVNNKNIWWGIVCPFFGFFVVIIVYKF